MSPPYTYCVKGRYWYFRKSGYLHPLAGCPGEIEFQHSYEAALAAVDQALGRRRRQAEQARLRRLNGANTPGTIYFIGAASGPIKIGFTTNLPSRLRRLQMNSPRKLQVLAAYDGQRADEIILHRQFRSDRLHGEWFKRSAGVLAVIENAR